MNITQLYEDFSIHYAPEGHKHYRPGWVNTECPFCTGNPGYHLGFNVDGNHYYCWRCGGHHTVNTVAKLIGTSKKEAEQILRKYKIRTHTPAKEIQAKINLKPFKLPSPIGPLTARHKNYLIERGFDADYLEKKYGLLGTGPISLLDKINYKHRIVAPIFWAHEQVTFQARDITKKHRLKYMACPKERELIHHKHILYNDPSSLSDIGICVEGITDVWRLGDFAFATFGIEYTPKQVRLISHMYKRVAVMFDEEAQAVIQANKLVGELKFRGVDAWTVSIDGDPGSMKQSEADELIKNIIG